MENRKSNLRVSLVVYDLDCDPDKLTETLGIKPTSVERKGDLTPSGKPKLESSNAWELRSNLVNESELDKHIRDLISKVKELKDVHRVSKRWGVKIDCVVEFFGEDNTPTLGLSKESIEKLALLKCSVDFDYYLHQGWR
ncbi:MAG: DUF4279 domain-containing protein [Bacteriovoracaceae bacterium]|nr:DUF4279 domain-containing protein [Bacteriovoracaceae bacterium]